MFICCDIHLNPGDNNYNEGFLKFMHWNLNSISAHNFARVSLLEAYNALHDFQLIAITESALKPSDKDDKIQINGYACIRKDLEPNVSHGGVLLYYKQNLAVKTRQDLETCPNLIVLELSISKKKVFFIIVYRKFGQTYDEFVSFKENLREILKKMNQEKGFCTVITGDQNAHLKMWWEGNEDNLYGTSLQSVFDEQGLFQLVNQPTYINIYITYT